MNNTIKVGRVCVVSHDAGGAEVISSYVKRNKLDCVYCLAGPAVDIFTKKIGSVTLTALDECLVECNWLLCSMGWSDHEWQALIKAKQIDKHTVVFLDHWTGFVSRFERDGVVHFPDELWVGDKAAEKIARKVFSNIPISLVPNPYYIDLKEKIDLISCSTNVINKGINILYICEPTAPVSDISKSSGYTDHEALRYFFACLAQKNELIERVVLRPHPTEKYDKYVWAMEDESNNVIISDGRDLLEDIVDSDWVVGRSSMGLVVGLIAEKVVFSCIPPSGKPCTLPYKEILHMKIN